MTRYRAIANGNIAETRVSERAVLVLRLDLQNFQSPIRLSDLAVDVWNVLTENEGRNAVEMYSAITSTAANSASSTEIENIRNVCDALVDIHLAERYE